MSRAKLETEHSHDRIREAVTDMLIDLAELYQTNTGDIRNSQLPNPCQARRMLYFVLRDNLGLGYKEMGEILKPIIPLASRSNTANAYHFLSRELAMDDSDALEEKWDAVQRVFKREWRATEKQVA